VEVRLPKSLHFLFQKVIVYLILSFNSWINSFLSFFHSQFRILGRGPTIIIRYFGCFFIDLIEDRGDKKKSWHRPLQKWHLIRDTYSQSPAYVRLYCYRVKLHDYTPFCTNEAALTW
jgi:hypothetical protein